jgi:hypothetical protein
MTEQEARDYELQLDIARLQKYLDEFKGDAETRAKIEKIIQDRIAGYRQVNAQSDPILKQMKSWADFAGNMKESATGWISSMSDALTQFVTKGKLDLSSLINSFINDTISNAMHWMLSGLGGKGTGGGSKAANIGTKAKSTKAFPLAHTGAIVGTMQGLHKAASAGVFYKAPRFHTGGIAGDEIPIIAKRKEGIFTPEQMAALAPVGTNRNMNFKAEINVSGGGGTNEQNRDLANRIGKELEPAMRAMILGELRTQMQPNGMLNR